MKHFRCGDVVPGCGETFTGTEDDVMTQVGAHAASDHGITEVGPELVDAVRTHMTSVA